MPCDVEMLSSGGIGFVWGLGSLIRDVGVLDAATQHASVEAHKDLRTHGKDLWLDLGLRVPRVALELWALKVPF